MSAGAQSSDALSSGVGRPTGDSGNVRALARRTAPITLDGRVDEAAWDAISPLPLSQFQPDPGGPMRDRSEIRIAYDDEYLYASGRFWDSERNGIRANSLLRDHYAEDDFLNLVIDTFHDRESAVWFIVTPNATRIDGSISNNAEGPESQWNHREYDMQWDAAATRTADGWSVEVRIPLSTLRFETRDGRVTMGLIAARVISRRKERHIFPAIRPTLAVAQFKPSLMAPVTLDVASVPRLVAVTPYVIGGTQTRRTAPSQGAPSDATVPVSRTVREAGADLKIGLSSRLTLDLTLNTDFAQTEVDDQRVNLTRFSLFFPERRQFFLERSGLFDVATGGNDRVFYSRRIGLGLDGLPVRVLGGGRLVGRAGRWDVGALDLLVDGAGRRRLDNAGVIRVRRNVLNPYSYIGAIATMSGGALGDAGRTVGLDGTVRLGDADFLVWSAASTWGGRHAPASLARDGSSIRAAWERRQRAGLSASSELRLVGEHYAPALGFVERTGIAVGTAIATYGWVGVRGAMQERSVGVAATVVRGHESRDIETLSAGPKATIVFVGGANVTGFVRARREVLVKTFHLGTNAAIAPGRHDWVEGGLSAGSSPGGLVRARVDLEAGAFYDGRRVSAALRPAWNISRHLELEGDVELNRVWLDARNQRFFGDVVRVRSRLALDPRLSLTSSLQYNRAAGVMTGSLRLRYAMREGTDLFVLLNDERVDTEHTVFGLPGARAARYFAMKYRQTIR